MIRRCCPSTTGELLKPNLSRVGELRLHAGVQYPTSASCGGSTDPSKQPLSPSDTFSTAKHTRSRYANTPPAVELSRQTGLFGEDVAIIVPMTSTTEDDRGQASDPRYRVFELRARWRKSLLSNEKALRIALRRASCSKQRRGQNTSRTIPRRRGEHFSTRSGFLIAFPDDTYI
ncbi:MAG: hypothetical protein KatS3mg104_0224 [Phycisphaerae bacterium]|nr:MAG: hypothetical protein KatS3mg104_0224 [Phycisphaerae bacterium]